MACQILLKYPDFSKTFHIYADDSECQLGDVLIQDNFPIAFYSRKLNTATKNNCYEKKTTLNR